jgi:hypothetical protein
MGLFDSLRAAMRVPTQAERERAYLNDARSQIDLELRHREIDRGRFRQTRSLY